MKKLSFIDFRLEGKNSLYLTEHKIKFQDVIVVLMFIIILFWFLAFFNKFNFISLSLFWIQIICLLLFIFYITLKYFEVKSFRDTKAILTSEYLYIFFVVFNKIRSLIKVPLNNIKYVSFSKSLGESTLHFVLNKNAKSFLQKGDFSIFKYIINKNLISLKTTQKTINKIKLNIDIKIKRSLETINLNKYKCLMLISSLIALFPILFFSLISYLRLSTKLRNLLYSFYYLIPAAVFLYSWLMLIKIELSEIKLENWEREEIQRLASINKKCFFVSIVVIIMLLIYFLFESQLRLLLFGF